MQPLNASKLVSLTYAWQQVYLDAMLVTEDKLPAAIEVAIETIQEREKKLLSSNKNDVDEMKSITDALANLRSLRRAP